MRPPPADHTSSASAPGVQITRCAAADLVAIGPDWDSLADRVAATPFTRPGWIGAWWRAFGSGSLEVLYARRGDLLDAVFPIVRRHDIISAPTNDHTPQFQLLQSGMASGAALGDELFSSKPRVVWVRPIRGDGTELGVLAAAAEAAGYRVTVRTLAHFPRVRIDRDWHTYKSELSRNLRQNLARCWRLLNRRGAVRLDVVETVDGLPEAFALESLGWKGTRRTAMNSHPATARFYTEIATWAAERRSLRLVFLRIDGHAIAFHLAIEEAGTYFPLKGGYDPTFHEYSPGNLIIDATLERAFTSGLKTYEFLGGEAEYKWRWATGATERIVFYAFPPTPVGRLTRAAFTYGRPLVTRALSSAPGARRSGRRR
jgi:CelD/BcsL family acetyltransferase involved in cellulose biosynthesis